MFRPEELPDAEGPFHLFRGKRTYGGIGIAETAVAEHRMSVKTADRSVDRDTCLVQNFLEDTEFSVSGTFRIKIILGLIRIPRNKVVVVITGRFDQSFLPCGSNDLRNFGRIEFFHDGPAERIAQGIGDAPEGHRTKRDAGFGHCVPPIILHEV
ncbi:hypothetical protein SDC9_179649 [bioreactor metagenome]|uniref:Uncharacterized protein n=1 Tax=bioreactor metagenome TaxID=1076179 RepID=A0A645H8R7_9ZZZZ